jgi:hypothetical protein
VFTVAVLFGSFLFVFNLVAAIKNVINNRESLTNPIFAAIGLSIVIEAVVISNGAF